MRLCKKPLRHRDYVYKLHPVEPYHDNCPCTGHQVVDWVGEQIEDVQEVAEEAVEGLKNMARTTLDALRSPDGMTVISTRVPGVGAELAIKAKLTIEARSNNPPPGSARPDSQIVVIPLGGFPIGFSIRGAVPDSTNGD